jgi:branched-subunit amino acid ABC-type transport system permease component
MIVAAAIALLLYIVLYKTRFGVVVRASMDDRETVSALGVRNGMSA